MTTPIKLKELFRAWVQRRSTPEKSATSRGQAGAFETKIAKYLKTK